MQGTWPSTPVRSIATPPDALRPVGPRTPLVDVLAVVRAPYSDGDNATNGSGSGATLEEEPSIPVIDNNKLLGSIDPARLQPFEEAGRQFGIEEALDSGVNTDRRGLFGRLAALLPAIMLLIAMAILGNVALHTDPVGLQGASANGDGVAAAGILFSNFRPADGDIVGLGQQSISVQVEGASPVVSATIMVDNRPLETKLAGSSPLTQTASAGISGLTLGQHTARINATTENGDHKNSQWHFRVDPRASAEPDAGATATAGAATPSSGGNNGPGVLQLARYRPQLGGRVLAGTEDVTVSTDLSDTDAPRGAMIVLDGKTLDTTVQPVSGLEDRYRLAATSPPVGTGLHTVQVELERAGGGSHSVSWTFSALKPDADHAYFKETGYFVSQPFLKYWQENGALGLFGYPISDLVQETNEAVGEVYTAQYFERARFEQHPSLGDAVVLGRLGALLRQPGPPAQPKPGAQFFPQTGHNVSPTFLRFWNEHGGLAVFGYPITEEQTEKNPIDGKEYIVQYFERNRFEQHPEMAGTASEVQLGLLGVQLYRQKYIP